MRQSCREFAGLAPLTLAFVPSQNFPRPPELPAPDRHIFYDRRVADIANSVPKLSGYWASEAYVTRSILADLFGRTRAARTDARNSGPMRNFLIDTDTASDDAVAILMALAAPT